MKKNSVILLIIAIAVIIVTVIGATYAYFLSGTINHENVTSLTGSTSDATNISLITLGDNISLNVLSLDMIESKSQITPIASEDGTLTIKLTAGSPEVPIMCTFDVYYVYESTSDNYTKTANADLEFTYKLYREDTQITYETNFVNTTSIPQKINPYLVGEYIYSNGTETTITYHIDTSFYNLDIDQSANAEKNYNIKFYIDASEERCYKYDYDGYTGTIYTFQEEGIEEYKTIVDPTYTYIWRLMNHPDGVIALPDELTCNYRISSVSQYFTDYVLKCIQPAGKDYWVVQDEISGEYTSDYNSQDSCESDLSFIITNSPESASFGFTCGRIAIPHGGIEYTTDVNEIRNISNVYLRHQTYHGIILSSETCLYNTDEICIDKFYYEYNKHYTQNKLHNDFTNLFGSSHVICSSNKDMFYCVKSPTAVDIFPGSSFIRTNNQVDQCFIEGYHSKCMPYE